MPKQVTRPPRPLAARLEASRRVKADAITRELLWAAIGSRLWPARLERPRSPQQSFVWLLVLDTPAGTIVYRVTDEEVPLFAHLARVDKASDVISEDKTAILLALSQEPILAASTGHPERQPDDAIIHCPRCDHACGNEIDRVRGITLRCQYCGYPGASTGRS